MGGVLTINGMDINEEAVYRLVCGSVWGIGTTNVVVPRWEFFQEGVVTEWCYCGLKAASQLCCCLYACLGGGHARGATRSVCGGCMQALWSARMHTGRWHSPHRASGRPAWHDGDNHCKRFHVADHLSFRVATLNAFILQTTYHSALPILEYGQPLSGLDTQTHSHAAAVGLSRAACLGVGRVLVGWLVGRRG